MNSRDTAPLNETKTDFVIGYNTDATQAASWDPDIVMTGSRLTCPVTQRSTFLSVWMSICLSFSS